MFLTDLRLSRLTFAGWVLLLVALGGIGLVSAVLGPWALASLDRGMLQSLTPLIVILLALPAVALAVLVWVLGARALAGVGVRVVREEREEQEHPSA